MDNLLTAQAMTSQFRTEAPRAMGNQTTSAPQNLEAARNPAMGPRQEHAVLDAVPAEGRTQVNQPEVRLQDQCGDGSPWGCIDTELWALRGLSSRIHSLTETQLTGSEKWSSRSDDRGGRRGKCGQDQLRQVCTGPEEPPARAM